MKLKTNLHFHSSEDPLDSITYSLFEGIDKAKSHNFDVLASTLHNKCGATEEHIAYAKSKNLLLISGIEKDIYTNHQDKNHVVILNCDKDAEKIHDFDDLRSYKANNPEIFILAPHPYMYGSFSLHDNLTKYIDIFDAIEHSWFYTKWFDRNQKAEQVAKEHKKPFVCTSDTHFFDFMDDHYTTIEADEVTPKACFEAIQNHNHENTTRERSLYDIFVTFGINHTKMEMRKILRRLKTSK